MDGWMDGEIHVHTCFPRNLLSLNFLSSTAIRKVPMHKRVDHSAVLGWLHIWNPRGRVGVSVTLSSSIIIIMPEPRVSLP